MTQSLDPTILPPPFPDHTQLPESDGTFVKNFQEHPQSLILTDSIAPTLQQLHPDGQFAIGQDCGIYWRETDPPERGAEAPDWFYVPNVPPLLLDGQIRRSYVIWREFIAPLIVLEFASGDGSEERDTTPLSYTRGETRRPGKFWVYEQIMRIPYYGIFEINNGKLEVYHFVDGNYHLLQPNQRGHYPIAPLGVELGLWQGTYLNQTHLWLRWWDDWGNLLLIGDERAELERQRAETERQRAETERQRAEQAEDLLSQERQQATQSRRVTVGRLSGLGLTVAQVAEALGVSEVEVRSLLEL